MGSAIVVGLVLLALMRIYAPESHNLISGRPIERKDGPSASELAKRVSDCLRDRKRRQGQFIKQYGQVEIPVQAVWSFLEDEEARQEISKRNQISGGFDRLRAARVDSESLADAISFEGSVFGIEVFPDRRYLLTTARATQSTISGEVLTSSSGTLEGSRGAAGDWHITVNTTSGDVIGTIDGSDSWISLFAGIEDSSLTVFAEIDQCRRKQRLREYSY